MWAVMTKTDAPSEREYRGHAETWLPGTTTPTGSSTLRPTATRVERRRQPIRQTLDLRVAPRQRASERHHRAARIEAAGGLPFTGLDLVLIGGVGAALTASRVLIRRIARPLGSPDNA